MFPDTDGASQASAVETRHGRAGIEQAAGVRIGYTVVRRSPDATKTVLLIHGAPQTRHAWRKVIPLLVAGYRVVAPDYRGAGASTKPRDGYDKWTMASDLHQLLHDELAIDEPFSVGHDLGSMFAFAYALRYRDDVVGLTTMEAPLPGTDCYEQRKVANSAWHLDFHANPTSPSTSPTAANVGTSPASSTTSPTSPTRSSTTPTCMAWTSPPTESSPSPYSPPAAQHRPSQPTTRPCAKRSLFCV
jgi:pimeloyl-ACP methyl ester carboxylesterase